MRVFILLLLALGWSTTAGAQNATLLDGSARSIALSGTVTSITDSWSSQNPASWSELASIRTAFSAGRLFGLAELAPVVAAATSPTPVGVMGIRARSYGFDAYRQTGISAGWASSFSLGTHRSLHVGSRVTYAHIRQQPPYGQDGAVGISLGAILPIFQQVKAGAYATNVNAPSVSGHELPRELGISIAYRISPDARFMGELNKDVRHPMSVRTGLEWLPHDVLALRLGSATAPFRFSAGAGFHLAGLRLDVGGVNHYELGWSPIASMEIAW